MKKFLLWFGIVLAMVIITIWIRRTYIQIKIDKSIEAYGIPKSEITKTSYRYSLDGYYEKEVWTKQDGEKQSYIFEYRGTYEGDKKVVLTFSFDGYQWLYEKTDEDMKAFHDFLAKNNKSLYYYPSPNPKADVYWE